MDQRRAAGALLALVVCITTTAAAPTVSNQTGLDLYDGAPEGCYYNFQHYGEGDRIMTNEPCLNCTCHNRMLMCYLRVCPFTKAIGQDCTVEKRADQCCPIVTCPDVPVDLLTSTSTTSPAEYGATGVGKLDKYGCSISGKYFPEGSKVPPTPNKPCEHCYCIRNMTTCVMQECTLHVDGCTPIYHKDVCCPVRYSCDHPEDTTLLLDDMTTTVRPTPGFLLTTTTLSPVTQMSQDCVHDDQIFPDGALIKTEKACEHCYCMKGDIVCVVQECGTPMENEGKNCTSQPPREGQCCPDTYICEGDEVTMEPFSEFTTQPQLEELTTLSPPRRVGVEGSGYRNEPDSYTEVPSIETEPEGSGYEHLTEQTAVDDNSIVTSESPEISSEAVDMTTVRTPIIEEVETTTEPDKGLNTVPSDEDMFKPSGTEKTPFEEPKVTETPLASVEGSVDSEDITTPEEAFMPVLTTKSDESSSTTETAFRKEDTLGEPTEVYNLGEPGKVSTLATEIEKETEEDVTSSKTKAPFIEELEKQTTLTPEFTHKDIEHETPSKDLTTESILEITTSEIKPVDKITTESVELGQKETTEIPVEKEDEAETTNADQNEVENISTTLPPGRIPGEGDCLLNDITYRNNSNVPSVNNCHTSCRCVSSIIKCDPIICSPPPEYMDNCQPTYDSPDACCPTYVCHTGETMPPQPHSQMSGTDKPLTSSSIECIGDECEIRKDDSVLNTDDCGSTGCVEGHPKKPEQPLEDCHDGKCSIPAQPCTDGNCQESPATNCENGKCGIEPEIVPVQQTPLCENESDCKGAVPEVSSCEGEGCVSGSVGCTGADCSTDITRQPTIPAPEGEKCEGDCKTPETIEPCTEQPCRRKETGDVGSYLPPSCSGSECTQPQIPSKGDDVNEMSTELPFTDDTDIKSTQQPEMTTVRHEIQTESAKTPDITEHQPTEMDDLAIREGSTMQPYEAESLGTEPSSQLVHDAVTKSPHNIEEDLSTSEPQPSVSDETRIRDIDATTKEPQDLATKSQEDILTVTEPQDVTSKVDLDLHKPESTEPSLHSESTESPQDVESHDARTTVAQEYSTSTPENQDKQTGSAEHGELYTESPEQKPTAGNEATEEPHTSEIDAAITKLPISDITEPHETEITDLSIHDLTESNEIDDKATKAPESVEQEIQITTETFQHELTTEQIMLATESQVPGFGTSHFASTEKDIKLPFTNAPVDLDTGITESVTKQSSEASTPKATENISDVTSSIPDLYKTEKQETYTESPAESVTESQESSTKQSVLSEIKPMQTESPEYTTDELVKESEVPVSDDDKKIQTTEATVKPSQEATTHTAISEEKTTLSEPTQAPVPLDVEKQQATKSPETNEITQDTAQAASEKPATLSTLEEHHVEEPDSKTTATDKTATETSDKHATEKPSQIPEDGFKTDEPESITEYSQEITEQPEISTEEPSIVEAPVKDEMPSEPYIPVHPEIASEFATAQPDINNEISDVEPDVGDAETETKVPEQLGTEIPDVKTPSPDTKVEGTQQPEVYTETPVIEEVDRDDHAKPAESETTKVPEDFVTNKTLEAVTTTLPKIEEDLEMTVSTEATEQPESAITEKVIDQTAESEPEKPSEHETLSTISVTQVTTIPSILAQESSEQPAEPVVTESGVSYATSVPESHVKEQDETVTQTSETNTYKPHDMVEPQEEVVTEGSTDIPSSPPEEKPLKEKPDADHDDKHEDKTGLPQGTRTPDETSTALLETVTEPAEEDISGKPQEPQKEETLPEDTATEKADKEVPSRTQSPDDLTTGPSTGLDTVVTEPTQHKVTEAQVDKEISTISLGEQEKTTYGSQDEITESPTRIPQEVTEISSDVTEKYTEIASQDDLPDSVTVTPEGADISSSNEVTTEKPLEEDIESRLTTQKTPEVIDMATLPQHQATEGPMVYDTQEPEKESTTDTPVSPTEETVGDEHTTPDVIELQEHSHIPTEDITTVSPAEEEKQTTETDKISKPSDEFSPEPHHTSPPQIDESETDTVVPTTNQPDMQIGDQRFGEDASQEEKEKPIQPIPGSEQSPVSDTEIPVQTERVPIETVTESELLHETAMLEVLTTSTSAKEEDESSTQKPEYVKPEERPLQEKPEKPIDEPAEKPLEEPIEKPLETSTSETPSEKPEIQPSEELEEPTETPLDEKTTELADDKPFKEEVPTETPEQKPLDMADEKPVERPSEDTDVKTEQKPEPGAEVTPQESFAEKPQDESEEKPLKSPEEKPQEAPEETPLETPKKTPQETAEKKPEVSGEQPQEAPEEKPQEVPEKKPQEAPQEQPEEMPEENPQEVSGEKPQGVPDKTEEKPQETPEEIPETPEKKPQEVPEEKPEIPEEKPQEVPEEKPQQGPEDKPEILEEEPQKIPEEKPQEAAEEKPETPDEKPQEVPGEKPQEAAEEKPETPEETPQELSGEKPQETAEKEIETPEEKPQGVPGEKPQEAAEKEPEAPEEKPQEVPGEKPQEAAEEKPETPAEKPQELPEEKPEIPEDKPQETTEVKPQEIPDKVAPEEKPLEMPEEKPQEETKEKPQETPEDKPETPEEMPQDVFGEKPQEAPEDKPETPKEKPQEVPKEEPEIPEEKPQEAAEEIPQKTPEKIPDTPEEKPQVVPEEKPEIPEEKPQDVIEGKPEEQPETPEEKPQEVPEEKPQKEPEEKPETPQEKPQEVLKEKPQETPEEKPEMPEEKPEMPEEKPQEVPEEKPVTPEENLQEVPEEKPVMTEEKPQEKPEEKPEMPEEKPQESPEEKPQEPEKKPQEEPEERPQEVPEQKPQEIPEEKPAEPASTTSPEITKPGLGDMLPTEEVPDDEGQFPPSGGTSGYGTEPDYVEEDQAFGPGTCRYGGKVYVSAQQIPRDDPCDFCFCFRSDIICLQQSCPPPIHGCHEEPIQGFCCPRYECPVAMATTLNVTTTTTTTTTTLPPHFLPHAYKGAAQRRGCQIKGHTYKVGEVVRASSGPCLHCTCGGDGQMKCDPKACTPEPMLRQMIAAAVSAKRRR